jgi:hypothetical protein
MKSMLRARSFDLFVNHQIRNHLQRFNLIHVARTIEQRQHHDNLIYEDVKNRFAHRFKEFSSHIAKNFERRNACSIHSFSFILFANRRQKSIDKTRTSYVINNFCNRIKNKLIETRERRRQREVITSSERKQQ